MMNLEIFTATFIIKLIKKKKTRFPNKVFYVAGFSNSSLAVSKKFTKKWRQSKEFVYLLITNTYMIMKKILVPVDFSEHTSTVCNFALEIIKSTGGELRLFHAYFDFMIVHNSGIPYSIHAGELYNQEMLIKIREDAKADMEKLVASLGEQLERKNITNVRIVHTLTGGMPEEEILNISETYAPDLIIMGTRGKGGKDILTGKVSSKVVQNTVCRILTVPREAQYNGFKNILYTTDFNDEDDSDLQRLIELLGYYNPMIHCIHIDIDDDYPVDAARMQKLKQQFPIEVARNASITFEVIRHDDFLEGVNEYVEANQIDLIAVVNHRRSFLKRLFTKDHTRELLSASDLPLFIFPGKAN
ncbi:universal stress protein [Candidatus Falkowbacteria bacterium]|nr:universal stress protein [Candidatus Falkowbacteria bacterium]